MCGYVAARRSRDGGHDRRGRHPPVGPDRVAAARARRPSGDDAARLSAMFGLLADPVRVLYALDLVQELCVGDVALALNVSEHAAGYALRILRTAGLISGRKSGRMVYYRLADAFPNRCASTASPPAEAP